METEKKKLKKQALLFLAKHMKDFNKTKKDKLQIEILDATKELPFEGYYVMMFYSKIDKSNTVECEIGKQEKGKWYLDEMQVNVRYYCYLPTGGSFF